MVITKMQATGNDFLLLDNREGTLGLEEKRSMAIRLCRRRLSFGADGMIFLDYRNSEIYMDFYNSDGTRGEMCGNGARCFSRYVFEELGVSEGEITFSALAGQLRARKTGSFKYSVVMPPISRYEKIELESQGYHYLEMGEPGLPHLLVEVDRLDRELSSEALRLRHHPGLSKGANVNFYKDRGDSIEQITYERGVEDFTLACGSGVSSVFYHLNQMDEKRNRLSFKLPGGTVSVEKDGKGRLYLEGPVIKVYQCELIEELSI